MEVSLSEQCFGDFLKLIHELTGITIGSNRTSLVEGRLRKRLVALNLPSFEAYLQLVRADRAEQVIFIDAVTTNETYFYRTPRIWDYVEKTLLPSWFAAHPNAVFTAWSAAASSGEEAHTLAVLCQAFKEKHPSFIYQITGTDISKEMVTLCQRGLYTGRSIESFRKSRPELFTKFLQEASPGTFEVRAEIKGRLKFSQHNLFKPLVAKEKFDLVLLRNVLIYFKGPDQERVISLIEPRLAPDGTVIIGESESFTHIRTNFKAIEAFVYRQNTAPDAARKAG